MIGLGSNRLTVCRRGGMSVTQAGRGGMEWLAGGRRPLWSQWWLPYSRQAGEALKAQFPTQWPTIRDYGFSHPEYIAAINFAAPQDPKIMYSLIPSLGKRRRMTGNQAKIQTNIIFDSETDLYCVALQPGTFASNFCGIQGSKWNINSIFAEYEGGNVYFVNNSTISTKLSVSLNEVLNIKMTFNGCYINDMKLLNSVTNYTPVDPIYLFGSNAKNKYNITIETCYAIKNGAEVAHYIPCIHDGKNGMVNLIESRFYENIVTGGSFTISETPS